MCFFRLFSVLCSLICGIHSQSKLSRCDKNERYLRLYIVLSNGFGDDLYRCRAAIYAHIWDHFRFTSLPSTEVNRTKSVRYLIRMRIARKARSTNHLKPPGFWARYIFFSCIAAKGPSPAHTPRWAYVAIINTWQQPPICKNADWCDIFNWLRSEVRGTHFTFSTCARLTFARMAHGTSCDIRYKPLRVL